MAEDLNLFCKKKTALGFMYILERDLANHNT